MRHLHKDNFVRSVTARICSKVVCLSLIYKVVISDPGFLSCLDQVHRGSWFDQLSNLFVAAVSYFWRSPRGLVFRARNLKLDSASSPRQLLRQTLPRRCLLQMRQKILFLSRLLAYGSLSIQKVSRLVQTLWQSRCQLSRLLIDLHTRQLTSFHLELIERIFRNLVAVR